MASGLFVILVYAVPATAVFGIYLALWMRRQRRHRTLRDRVVAAGLDEPASLHPRINLNRCIGCGLCADACPENDVLAVISGKAVLVDPSHCIGHGACRAACPVEAIVLVFGTARRGVDIPRLKPNFETDVPGLFIAGELGGMGLIRNAMTQGMQAIEAIAALDGLGAPDRFDVAIVGAGPAGIAATLAAQARGLRYVTLEQESFGGTVAHYPRGKIVMTAPVDLPLVGRMHFTETTKEALLDFWRRIEAESGIRVNTGERVEGIARDGDGFAVATPRETYRARAVLLAIGRRGTPRKLGVPGEDLPKVVYRMIDPEQYAGRRVLVVGGGDSALEAATAIAEVEGAAVALSYRGEAFSRAKEKNRARVAEAEAAGRLRVLLASTVREIGAETVTLDHRGETVALDNDDVIVCAGGILPTAFLKKIGIAVETKYGTP